MSEGAVPMRRPWAASDSGASLASERDVRVFDGRAVFGDAPKEAAFGEAGGDAALAAALADWAPGDAQSVSDAGSVLDIGALRAALDEAIPPECAPGGDSRPFDLLGASLRGRGDSGSRESVCSVSSGRTIGSDILERTFQKETRDSDSVIPRGGSAIEGCAASLASDTDQSEASAPRRSRSAYADVFCGEDGRGFRTLVQRMRYGRRATEALLAHALMRVETEEEYGRRLHRAARAAFPRQDAFLPAGSVWDGAVAGLAGHAGELAAARAAACERVRERVLRPLEASLRAQARVKARHKDEMARLARARAAAAEAAARRRERYAKLAAEAKRLNGMAAPTGPRAVRHAEALAAAEDAERAAAADAAVADGRLLELESHCYAAMRAAAADFEATDRERLLATRSALCAFAGAMADLSRRDAAAYASQKEHIASLGVSGDMAAFAAGGVRRARVLHAFSPRRADELRLAPGETVSVEDTALHPWWRGTDARGRRGLYPSNYVSPLWRD